MTLAHYFVGPSLLAAAFALLAAAGAFTLDESASAVVDVTPTDRRANCRSHCCAHRAGVRWARSAHRGGTAAHDGADWAMVSR